MEEEQYLGTEVVDKIEEGVGFVAGLPGIKEALNFAGGVVKFADQAFLDPHRRASEEGEIGVSGALGTVIRAGEGIIDMATEGGGIIAKSAGVDPRIGQFVGGTAAETLLTAGAGTVGRKVVKAVDTLTPPGGGMALATTAAGPNVTFKSGSVNLTPTVNKLTLKDPANIPEGIKKGSAFKDPKFAPQMKDFYQRRANIKERLQAAADRKSKRVGKLKEEGYNTISTGPSRAPELDPEAYGDKKAFEKFKEQSEITPLTPSGNVKWQQQHHMFSKQESYQFVERMIELGDDDDVLALFIMAEDMDAVMGGRLSNMLNMEDLPHSVFHGSRITDKRQLQSAAMRNLVENAKSPDELMRMFRKYVTENVQPSKEEAKAFKIIGQRLLKADKFGELEQIRDKMYR